MNEESGLTLGVALSEVRTRVPENEELPVYVSVMDVVEDATVVVVRVVAPVLSKFVRWIAGL